VGRTCSTHGKTAHKILTWKLESRENLEVLDGRLNAEMNHEEIGLKCGDWINLAQDTKEWQVFVKKITNLRVSQLRYTGRHLRTHVPAPKNVVRTVPNK
jgi:hypothetical protein